MHHRAQEGDDWLTFWRSSPTLKYFIPPWPCMPCAHLAVCMQAWADQCWFEHSQYAYGENVAVGQMSLLAAIDAWYREVRVSIQGHREVVNAA